MPISDRQTLMLGKRPNRLWSISAGGQLEGGPVAPVHHPLESVEVPEDGGGVLGPVGPVLLIVGAAQVHGEADVGLVDDGPEPVVDRVGGGAAHQRVGRPAVGVTGLGLDDGGPIRDDLFEFLNGQLGVGQGDVRRAGTFGCRPR